MLKHLRHLNGWQRIGVVLSVLWFFYGAYLGTKEGSREVERLEQEHCQCIEFSTRYYSPEGQKDLDDDIRQTYPAQQQSQALRQSICYAATQNPEEYAKQLQKAAQTGIVPKLSQDCQHELELKQAAQVNREKALSDELVRARKRCDELRERKLPKAISKGWYAPAFFGLVPIPLGWLAVYGFVALVRWIMKGGFKGPKQPPADTAQQNTRR